MKLSIVTTLYRSENELREFYSRSVASAKKLNLDFEIVLVNDGSPDESLSIANELLEEGENLKIVNLSKNFGQHKAMMTGLRHAQGDLIFLIDADLEEPPELLESFHKELQSDTDLDVVYGIRIVQKTSLLKRLPRTLFYWFFNLMSDIQIPSHLCVARIMSRRYVDQLLLHKEREVTIGGLWAITGFKQKSIPVEKTQTAQTTYTLAKLLTLTLNTIVSFSTKPLTLFFWLGCFIQTTAIIAVTYTVYIKLFRHLDMPGYSFTIVSIWFLGGTMIFGLGLIGLYVGMLFKEVKARPITVVKEVLTNYTSN